MVTNCVIPPPSVSESGKLQFDWASCTSAEGKEVTMQSILTQNYVCHPSEDYLKVLEGMRR